MQRQQADQQEREEQEDLRRQEEIERREREEAMAKKQSEAERKKELVRYNTYTVIQVLLYIYQLEKGCTTYTAVLVCANLIQN